MGFLDTLLGRQQKVTNQKLADDISNLCEELTSGIIELSNKANKINELKEKYNKSQSELEASSTNPNSAASNPKEGKSILSGLFGSDDDDVPPAAAAAATNQPQPDVNSPTTGDNIDADSLSSASTAQLASPGNKIDKPFSSDLSQRSDIFSSSSPSLDLNNQAPEASIVPPPPPPPEASIVPPPPPAAQPEASAISLDSLQPPPDQQIVQVPREQDKLLASSDIGIGMGGKNRKKSKRSKQTIRKANKNSNRVTKKQKNTSTTTTTTDNKANTQGLAQALLQAQGQA